MLSWPLTKGIQDFKKLLLGGDQPKTPGSVDSMENKQKETIHPSVEREFTPVPFRVAILKRDYRKLACWREWLLDFSFSSLIWGGGPPSG